MAKTKEEKAKALASQEAVLTEEVVEAESVESTESTDSIDSKEATETKETRSASKAKSKSAAPKNGPTYDELLAIVQQLAGEVQTLKASGTQAQTTTQNTIVSEDSKTDKILEMLANRKSDKEVVIVHNCELLGGLSTHIELTGLTIDFHTLGEQRLLSWQQFEECVSKYRSFFEREIILLSEDEKDLSLRYSIPCIKREGKSVLTHSDITGLSKLTPRKLEDFVNTLSDADKDFVFSYWLGKCYEKAAGFYDRYKIEMLNNLSEKHVFDNLLTLMNGDFRDSKEQQ